MTKNILSNLNINKMSSNNIRKAVYDLDRSRLFEILGTISNEELDVARATLLDVMMEAQRFVPKNDIEKLATEGYNFVVARQSGSHGSLRGYVPSKISGGRRTKARKTRRHRKAHRKTRRRTH